MVPDEKATPTLPQEGWFRDDEWAYFFQIELRTLRRKIRELNIPHKVFGNILLINAAVLYERLPDGGFDPRSDSGGNTADD